MKVFISSVAEGSPDMRSVRAMKAALATASRLRYDLAHEMTHEQLVLSGKNDTGMSAATMVVRWLTDITRVDRLGRKRVDEFSTSAAFVQSASRVNRRLPEPPIMPATLAFREDALQKVGRALLRFLDGIVTAVCITLSLALTALAQLPDGLSLVLVMLAVCLRYGRRDEPGDHAFLSPRRCQS